MCLQNSSVASDRILELSLNVPRTILVFISYCKYTKMLQVCTLYIQSIKVSNMYVSFLFFANILHIQYVHIMCLSCDEPKAVASLNLYQTGVSLSTLNLVLFTNDTQITSKKYGIFSLRVRCINFSTNNLLSFFVVFFLIQTTQNFSIISILF